MQAQRAPADSSNPDHPRISDWRRSRRSHPAYKAVGMAAETALFTAFVVLLGRVIGIWLGVENPVDPRTPGGPTPPDLEAFAAIGAVFAGLGISAWRVQHGALVILAGAIAFGIALPDLVPMALMFGLIGAINLGCWLFERIREERRHHDEPPPETQHQRPVGRHAARPKHVAGFG
jgi:hypothetical protein